MSRLHYFQRYDNRENWVTNSTLLLLSRLYHYNRSKFETVINAILTDSNLSLNVGVKFTQQERGQTSVVDGIISQDSFKVVIETKLYDNFSSDQLKRHLDAFGEGQSQKILLALSKSRIDNHIRSEVIKTLQGEKYKEIQFASTTYEFIYQAILSCLSEFDVEMRDILDDYISLCSEHGLTNIQNQTMLVFTASESLTDNLKYRIYYNPVTRNHSYPFKFIGLYVNKAVVAVGQLSKSVSCNYENGKLIATEDDNLEQLSAEEYDRIKSTIETTDYYDLETGNKFFLVDRFYETNYKKVSYSSIRAKKYFWLDDIEGFTEGMNAEQIATLLDGKEWE